jgi:hypothetical protein
LHLLTFDLSWSVESFLFDSSLFTDLQTSEFESDFLSGINIIFELLVRFRFGSFSHVEMSLLQFFLKKGVTASVRLVLA